MEYKLYRIVRPIVRFLMKIFYRIEIINSEYIPDTGCILAGNHKSNLDCVLLMSSTKRTIRFLGKVELFKKHGWIFRNMGVIPVNRSIKNKKAVSDAIDVLKKDGIIGIFPEGTFNDTEYVTRPFKIGAVKFSYDAKKPIVPFAIINDYKLFRKSVKIIFGKPYVVKNSDLVYENNRLMNKVIKLMKEDYEKE